MPLVPVTIKKIVPLCLIPTSILASDSASGMAFQGKAESTLLFSIGALKIKILEHNLQGLQPELRLLFRNKAVPDLTLKEMPLHGKFHLGSKRFCRTE
jgi:hypothetical protein